MIVGYKHLANRDAWEFGCTEGTWTGRLDDKARDKSQNLILYFADEATGGQYWFSAFNRNGYRARVGGDSFRNAATGDVFELTTKKTKKGNPDLRSAHKINSITAET
jgi:hypothetical protein